MDYILEKLKTPVVGKKEVIIIGGGTAGVAAALAAARAGASVLIIENNSCLGGMTTSGLMNSWTIPVERTSGIAFEIAKKLMDRNMAFASSAFSYDVEALKELLIELTKEAGVELRLNTRYVKPIMGDEKIDGVICEEKDGRKAFLSSVVIDCTGDGDVAASCGEEMLKGRESDGKMRPVTLLFQIAGVDLEKLIEYADKHSEDFSPDPRYKIVDRERKFMRLVGFFNLVEKAHQDNALSENVNYIRFEGINMENGLITVNSTRVYGIDGTKSKSLSEAYIELRKQIKQLLNFIKSYIPGCKNVFLVKTGEVIGVRETRRVKGPFVLTETDHIAKKMHFEDVVACLWKHYKIGKDDPHPVEPIEGKCGHNTYRSLGKLNWFEVPYRALLPVTNNLLLGGRCISQDHKADIWTRDQPCCYVTGQVAGCAASIAVSNGISPKEINIKELQNLLSFQGVLLEGGGMHILIK